MRRWPARMRVLRRVTAVAAALVVGGVSAASATVDNSDGPGYEERCVALADVGLEEVIDISAELVTSGSFTDPEGEGQDQEDLPEFCRVALTVEPQINIEVWLPTDTWNGDFQAVGNGYFGGFVAYRSMGPALRAGYATASTDMGHPETGTNGEWAMAEEGERNMQLIEDFASRSLFELTEKSKTLIDAFYDEGPEYSYWTGCSTGGRQGMMLAQRMPGEYDGILSAAPAINWDRFLVAEMWPQVVMHQDLGAPIPTCKLELAVEAAVEYLDPLDGVTDGVIEDPNAHDFDLSTLVGTETDCGVFTQAEADAIQKIWDGPRTADGEFLWYGLEPGAPLGDDPNGVGPGGGIFEPGGPGWDRLAGTNPFLVSEHYIKYFVLADPDWDYRTLTYDGFEEIFRLSQQDFNDVLGTDDPDLSEFRDAGGKLLMWHGWNDRMIFPMGSIDYFERVQDELDGDVTDFYRLFMAPGVDHCSGGPGPQPVNLLGALVDWVEHDDAPEQLEAAVTVDGEVVRTRPLCLYPEVAVYDGTGSTDEAGNFDCQLQPAEPEEPGKPGPQPPAPPQYGFFLTNGWAGGAADVTFMYGRFTDEVLIGDWDGDGTDSITVRRGKTYYVNNHPRGGPAESVFHYGHADDVVLVGDWDGDGTDTLAVRRGNAYHVKNSLSGGPADHVVVYGRAGDEVSVGDWDGDMRDTFAVRRGAAYHVKNTLAGGPGDVVFTYGRPGDVTLAGDWDGDGDDSFAVRRGNVYYVNFSLRGGEADLTVAYGRAGDEVYVGDWDGDGTDTLGVRRTP